MSEREQLAKQLLEEVKKLKHLAVSKASYDQNMEQAELVLKLWNELDKLNS